VSANLTESLVLKTMTQAYHSWPGSDSTVTAKLRLFRILAREFRNTGNREQPSHWFLPPQSEIAAGNGDCDPQGSDEVAPHGGEPLTSTEMTKMAIDRAIARLDVQPRLIMILLFRENFSYADIVYITELSKDSVKSTLGRLRRLIPRYVLKTTDSQAWAENSHARVEGATDLGPPLP
jgi:DNA-directed RNA polymerase specialized sigma24 family protein